MMKKLLSVLVLLLCSSCMASNNIIPKINQEAQKNEKFASVSVTKAGKAIIGRLWTKNKNTAIEVIIWYKDNLGLQRTNLGNVPWKYINYYVYDLNNKRVKSLNFSDNGTILAEKVKNYPPFSKSVWEDTFRGVAVAPDMIKVTSAKTVQVGNLNWRKTIGNYDLKGDIENQMPREGNKGVLTLWYDNLYKSTVEAYKTESGEPLVLRKIWLGEVLPINPDHKEGGSLVKLFIQYYNKANFKAFLTEN